MALGVLPSDLERSLGMKVPVTFARVCSEDSTAFASTGRFSRNTTEQASAWLHAALEHDLDPYEMRSGVWSQLEGLWAQALHSTLAPTAAAPPAPPRAALGGRICDCEGLGDDDAAEGGLTGDAYEGRGGGCAAASAARSKASMGALMRRQAQLPPASQQQQQQQQQRCRSGRICDCEGLGDPQLLQEEEADSLDLRGCCSVRAEVHVVGPFQANPKKEPTPRAGPALQRACSGRICDMDGLVDDQQEDLRFDFFEGPAGCRAAAAPPSAAAPDQQRLSRSRSPHCRTGRICDCEGLDDLHMQHEADFCDVRGCRRTTSAQAPASASAHQKRQEPAALHKMGSGRICDCEGLDDLDMQPEVDFCDVRGCRHARAQAPAGASAQPKRQEPAALDKMGSGRICDCEGLGDLHMQPEVDFCDIRGCRHTAVQAPAGASVQLKRQDPAVLHKMASGRICDCDGLDELHMQPEVDFCDVRGCRHTAVQAPGSASAQPKRQDLAALHKMGSGRICDCDGLDELHMQPEVDFCDVRGCRHTAVQAPGSASAQPKRQDPAVLHKMGSGRICDCEGFDDLHMQPEVDFCDVRGCRHTAIQAPASAVAQQKRQDRAAPHKIGSGRICDCEGLDDLHMHPEVDFCDVRGCRHATAQAPASASVQKQREVHGALHKMGSGRICDLHGMSHEHEKPEMDGFEGRGGSAAKPTAPAAVSSTQTLPHCKSGRVCDCDGLEEAQMDSRLDFCDARGHCETGAAGGGRAAAGPLRRAGSGRVCDLEGHTSEEQEFDVLDGRGRCAAKALASEPLSGAATEQRPYCKTGRVCDCEGLDDLHQMQPEVDFCDVRGCQQVTGRVPGVASVQGDSNSSAMVAGDELGRKKFQGHPSFARAKSGRICDMDSESDAPKEPEGADLLEGRGGGGAPPPSATAAAEEEEAGRGGGAVQVAYCKSGRVCDCEGL